MANTNVTPIKQKTGWLAPALLGVGAGFGVASMIGGLFSNSWSYGGGSCGSGFNDNMVRWTAATAGFAGLGTSIFGIVMMNKMMKNTMNNMSQYQTSQDYASMNPSMYGGGVGADPFSFTNDMNNFWGNFYTQYGTGDQTVKKDT